jgi:hypothetical protein
MTERKKERFIELRYMSYITIVMLFRQKVFVEKKVFIPCLLPLRIKVITLILLIQIDVIQALSICSIGVTFPSSKSSAKMEFLLTQLRLLRVLRILYLANIFLHYNIIDKRIDNFIDKMIDR